MTGCRTRRLQDFVKLVTVDNTPLPPPPKPVSSEKEVVGLRLEYMTAPVLTPRYCLPASAAFSSLSCSRRASRSLSCSQHRTEVQATHVMRAQHYAADAKAMAMSREGQVRSALCVVWSSVTADAGPSQGQGHTKSHLQCAEDRSLIRHLKWTIVICALNTLYNTQRIWYARLAADPQLTHHQSRKATYSRS